MCRPSHSRPGRWPLDRTVGRGGRARGTWDMETRVQAAVWGAWHRDTGRPVGGGVHTERAGPAPQESQQWGPLLTRGRVEEALRGPDPVSYREQKTW